MLPQVSRSLLHGAERGFRTRVSTSASFRRHNDSKQRLLDGMTGLMFNTATSFVRLAG